MSVLSVASDFASQAFTTVTSTCISMVKNSPVGVLGLSALGFASQAAQTSSLKNKIIFVVGAMVATLATVAVAQEANHSLEVPPPIILEQLQRPVFTDEEIRNCDSLYEDALRLGKDLERESQPWGSHSRFMRTLGAIKWRAEAYYANNCEEILQKGFPQVVVE